jgi:hypothetical protein
MIASRWTRRALLAHSLGGALGGGIAVFLVGCGRAMGSQTPPPSGVASVAQTAAATHPDRRVTASTVIAASPTLANPPFVGACIGGGIRPTPSPEAPYVWSIAVEGVAQTFAARVRAAPLILLVSAPGYFPARWTTPDGARPPNPHSGNSYTIITPERTDVVAVAKGSYDFPQLYMARFGRRIGQDCVSASNSLFMGGGPVGTRFLYLLESARYPEAMPVPDDPRYRFYAVSRSYPVSPDGTITIGPEHDIMGHHYDNPPRTLPVGDVLTEIATLAAAPATPTIR